jgi:type IV secretory pathway VirB4 component
MKSTKTSVLLAAAMLVLTTPLFAQAPKFDAKAAQSALKSKIGSINKRVVVDDDASLSSCKAFQDLRAKANADYAACVNEATAPAGSPIDKFNKATNVELAQICGTKTLDQCVADVIKAQEEFCKAKVKPTQDAAAAARKECIEAAKECAKAQSTVKAIEASIVTLDAKKKQLEADLKKATDDLTAKNAELTAAKAKVTAECKR